MPTFARPCSAADHLDGCEIVSGTGDVLGTVHALLLESGTRRLRHIIMHPSSGGCPVYLPWQSLYYDAALTRVVFYTFD